MTQQNKEQRSTFVGTMVAFGDGELVHRVTLGAKQTRMINMQLQSLDGDLVRFATFDRQTPEDSESVGETMLRTNREGTVWSVDYTTYTSNDGTEYYTIRKASAVNSKPASQHNTVQGPPVAQATPPPATPVLGSRDLSIIRQVAFKGAIEKAEDPKDVYRLTDAYERILLGKPLQDELDIEETDEDLFINVSV